MITLEHDSLVFRFPHLSEAAKITVNFQRTLRLPDDGRTYSLPPGLGGFPLRHIEDYDLGPSDHRKDRGGLIMPMYQTDALWMNFSSNGLPAALRIGAGKINAVSGRKWSERLTKRPQNYVVLPDQPWLDGFNVGKGVIRQFVAAPLGKGYTVEEQIDSESDIGGIQIEAIPPKKKIFERFRSRCFFPDLELQRVSAPMEMGLGMGGTMEQEIYKDPYGLDAWDLKRRQRCFIMLANAEQWLNITGELPPLQPMSAAEYSMADLPWFDYYDDDRKVIEGAKALGKLKSVKDIAGEKRDPIWPEESSDFSYTVKKIKGSKVKDGSW